MAEQSDARKSPVGRDFESEFFGGDCVIASVTRIPQGLGGHAADAAWWSAFCWCSLKLR
jgi:hypothetical protein